MTTHIEGQVIPSNVPGNLAMATRQGAGVVLGMAPWNAPVILAVRAIATPLTCGNTVILKGSELSPATQGLIIDALAAAGFPSGVVNYLTCAPQDAPTVVETLIAHHGVRRVNLRGWFSGNNHAQYVARPNGVTPGLSPESALRASSRRQIAAIIAANRCSTPINGYSRHH